MQTSRISQRSLVSGAMVLLASAMVALWQPGLPFASAYRALVDYSDLADAMQNDEGLHTFNVMSWNVLAREYTFFYDKIHKVQQGNRARNGQFYEGWWMTNQRYKIVVDEILAQQPDIALLQEVEASFMDNRQNPSVMQLLQAYRVPEQNGHPFHWQNPGGVVAFVKNGVPVGVATKIVHDRTKASIVVPVNVGSGGRQGFFIGMHLPWVGDRFMNAADAKAQQGINQRNAQRQSLLENTLSGLPAQSPACVMGDFNVEPNQENGRWGQVAQLFARYGFTHLTPRLTTGFHTDLKQTTAIDHVFCRTFQPYGSSSGVTAGQVLSPYADRGGHADIQSASDHTWLHLKVSIDNDEVDEWLDSGSDKENTTPKNGHSKPKDNGRPVVPEAVGPREDGDNTVKTPTKKGSEGSDSPASKKTDSTKSGNSQSNSDSEGSDVDSLAKALAGHVAPELLRTVSVDSGRDGKKKPQDPASTIKRHKSLMDLDDVKMD